MASKKPTKPAAAAKTSKKPAKVPAKLDLSYECLRGDDGLGARDFIRCDMMAGSITQVELSAAKAMLLKAGHESLEVLAHGDVSDWDPRNFDDFDHEAGWVLVAVLKVEETSDVVALFAKKPWPFPKTESGGPDVKSDPGYTVIEDDFLPSDAGGKPEVEPAPAKPVTARKGFFLPPKARLLLVKTTPHKEHHGKDLVQAISLRLRWETTGESLNLLHPNLQAMLFYRRPSVEAQAELPDLPQVVPNLRVPTAVLPLKMEAEYTGYTIEIEYGIDESTALELYTCHLQKFTCDGKEGGTAVIEWSLHSNKNITPELVGVLCGLEGTTITADLIPPTVTAGEAIDGTVGHPGVVTRDPDNGPDATDLFSEAHGRGADGEAQEPGDEREPAEEGAES